MEKYYHMTNSQLVEEFYKIWKESNVSKSNIGKYIRNHFYSFYAQIEERTVKLNQYVNESSIDKKKRYISIFERLYCLEHGLDDRPMCKLCGKKHVAGFFAPKNKYGEYCSSYCQRRSPLCVQHGIQTKKDKYGEEDYMHWKKAHETRVSRYGSHHPKDYPQKVKATKLKNYGDENFVNVEKIHQTVERHKAENPYYYYDREQKSKKTKIENGHDPNWNNREKFKKTLSEFTDDRKQEIKHKRKQTCQDYYGCDFPMQSKEVKDKTASTNIKNYGVKSLLSLQKTRVNMQCTLRKKAWDIFQSGNFEVLPMIDEQTFTSNISFDLRKDLLKWKCKKCGHIFEHSWSNWKKICPKCHPQNFRGMQTQIEEYVKSICKSNEVRRDCKSILKDTRQLDIYIPYLNIAIEFNGCFWHNSDLSIYGKKPMPISYHAEKTDECLQYGIRLLHIFEDEWIGCERLCKSKLKKILCPTSVRHIDATMCEVFINEDEYKKEQFLNKYTFYGNDGSSLQYCLTFKGHIIAMMTLSKTRNDKQHDWQILNYVEVNSIIVDGGFQMLLNAFMHHYFPTSIVMRVSRDWNSIEDFIDSFDKAYVDKPRLYWTHDGCRIKGSTITQMNAHSILHQYDETKSFIQNMNDNKYYRIYDSGTIVLERHIANSMLR